MPKDDGCYSKCEMASKIHDYSLFALLRTCRKIYSELIPEVYKNFSLHSKYHMRGGIPTYFTGMAFMPTACIEKFSGLRRLGRNLEYFKDVSLTCGSITALVHREIDTDSGPRLDVFEGYATRPLDDFKHIYELLKKACPNLRSVGLAAWTDQDLDGINKEEVWNNHFQGSPTDAEVGRRIAQLGIRSLLRGLKHFRHIKTIVIEVEKSSLGELRPRKIAKELAFRYTTRESKGNDIFELCNPGWNPPTEKTARPRRVKRPPIRRTQARVSNLNAVFTSRWGLND